MGQVGADLRETVQEILVFDDADRRPGVGGQVLDLLGRRRVVDRDRSRATEVGRRVEYVELGHVAQHQHHSIARLDSEGAKTGSGTSDAVAVFGPIERPPLVAFLPTKRRRATEAPHRVDEGRGHGLTGDRGRDLVGR